MKKIQNTLILFLSVIVVIISSGQSGHKSNPNHFNTKDTTKIKVFRNCGKIIDMHSDYAYWWWFDVKNNYTGNVRSFYVTERQFFQATINDNICIDSLKVW